MYINQEKFDKLEEDYKKRYNEVCAVMEEKVNKYGDIRNSTIPQLFGKLNGYLRIIDGLEDDEIVIIKRVHAMRTVIDFTKHSNKWTNRWFINDLERELRLLSEDMKNESRYNFNTIRFVLRYIEYMEGKETYEKIKYWIRHYKNDKFVKEVLKIISGKNSIDKVDDMVEYVTG